MSPTNYHSPIVLFSYSSLLMTIYNQDEEERMGRSATLGRRVGERYTNHQVTILLDHADGDGGGDDDDDSDGQ